MFGAMATVAAGYTWVPLSGFLASILHFSLSSWLFLHFPKPGKIIAILTGTIMCIWPVMACIDAATHLEWLGVIFFLIPIACSGLVIFNHIKTFHQDTRPALIPRIILTVIPLGPFLLFLTHILIQAVKFRQ